MDLRGHKTFVGFGFGPIQAGLFVLEAFRSGSFGRVVVAEVLPRVVASIRGDHGRFRLNEATLEGVEQITLGPIEIEDPAAAGDRARLIDAVAVAAEIATAVPSVSFYRSAGPGSLHRILAAGLERRGDEPVVIYAAENHNHAAELLEEAVLEEVTAPARDRVRSRTRFLNTVIGKMSAVIADPARVAATGLATITAGDPRAFLVESFNRILVSAIRFPPGVRFARGLSVFEEKPDLLPFEEAKLHGHNAAHALTAYIAALRGLTRMDEIQKVPGALDLVRAALLEEAGAALVRKHRGLDPLFTEAGFRAHADDLLARMLNPCLGDLVERVARDPARKLAWEDRLVGTMRLCLGQGITPRRFALGAAAALLCWRPELRAGGVSPEAALEEVWSSASPGREERRRHLQLIEEALTPLRAWLRGQGPLTAATTVPPR
jgi:mannitol-1-phosphate 5-dehydrogenase